MTGPCEHVVMVGDADSERVPLWFIPLVMGGLMAFLAVGGHGLWEDAVRLRAASQGSSGTVGTFVATELRQVGMPPQECYGTFRPDEGGRERHDVQMGVKRSDCVRGRTFRGRLTGGQAVLRGDDGWRAVRAGAVTMWVFIPPTGVAAVLAFRVERRKRRRDNNLGKE